MMYVALMVENCSSISEGKLLRLQRKSMGGGGRLEFLMGQW